MWIEMKMVCSVLKIERKVPVFLLEIQFGSIIDMAQKQNRAQIHVLVRCKG